jgi:hypothetical protein
MKTKVDYIMIHFFMSPEGKDIFNAVLTVSEKETRFKDITATQVKKYLNSVVRANSVFPVISMTNLSNSNHRTKCGPWVI